MSEITEDRASYDLAVILEDKGFNLPVTSYYDANEEIHEDEDLGDYNSKYYAIATYSRPTLSHGATWLAFKYGICAYIDWLTLECVIVDHNMNFPIEVFRKGINEWGKGNDSPLNPLLIEACKLIKE